MSYSLRPHELQHTRLLCPPLSPRIFSNACPLSLGCYLTISSSAAPFSFCLQSFPALGAFPANVESAACIRWPKCWSFSFSIVLQVNIRGWFPFPFMDYPLSWQRDLCNSMKLWAMPCRATQDWHVIAEISDKHDPLEEEMANHPSIPAMITSWTVKKDKKIYILLCVTLITNENLLCSTRDSIQ